MKTVIQMTPKLEKLIEEAEQDIKNGKTSPAYENVEDFLKDLKN